MNLLKPLMLRHPHRQPQKHSEQIRIHEIALEMLPFTVELQLFFTLNDNCECSEVKLLYCHKL